jgi:DNA primase
VTDLETAKRKILDRVRLEDVVGEHVSLRRRGGRLVGLCPFHSEKTPSFTVNSDRGFFKCFGCGKGGDVFSFVQLRDNAPFMDALRLLADRAGVTLPTRSSAPQPFTEGPSRGDLLKANGWAMEFFKANLKHEVLGRAAREYLRSRGFNDAARDAFGLGLAGEGPLSLRGAAAKAPLEERLLIAADLLRTDDTGRSYETFRSRLMFPIRDSTGRVLGFGGRTLVDDPAKYINTRQTPLFDKGRLLYGLDAAREAIAKTGRAIVVEGYTDCMACHQAGFKETVATLGTALTEYHVDLLRRFADEVVLLFDSDAAGEAAADRAITVALPRCVRVLLARIPDGKDPGDFLPRAGASGFSDVLKSAIEALEFKWFTTRRRFEADASDARRREAVLEFVRVVAVAVSAEAVDAIRYGLLVNQVAHLLGIDRAEVARLMERSRKPRTTLGASKTAVAGTADAAVAAGRTAEQSAWTHVLEVLLNRPDLLGTVENWPPLQRIADEQDRRIAAAIFGAAEESCAFTLADVLSRCSEPADGARITQLADRGAARGNYEATLRLALERLGQGAREAEVEETRRRLLAVADGEGGAARAAEQKLSDGVKEHRHYVPRRLRRRVAGEWNQNGLETINIEAVADNAMEPS